MNVEHGVYAHSICQTVLLEERKGIFRGIHTFFLRLLSPLSLSFFLLSSLTPSHKLWYGCMLYNIEENGSMKERGKKNSFLSLCFLAEFFPLSFSYFSSLLPTDRKQQLFHMTGQVVVQGLIQMKNIYFLKLVITTSDQRVPIILLS